LEASVTPIHFLHYAVRLRRAIMNATNAAEAMPGAPRWDVFCKVVDNYGDAGFCYRLARQLAAEHALEATLWLDDLGALKRIAHDIDPARAEQKTAGITLRRWHEPFEVGDLPDAVVEAFGCGLPEAYIRAMPDAPRAPKWFVLEYLSAESWIEGAHGGASPHPRLSLARRFWFPGFTSATGGLLRERGLAAAREACCGNPAFANAFWSSLHLPPSTRDELRISLFCYPNPALPALFDAWADGDARITCIVPEGVAAGALDLWSGGNVPHPGHPYERGRLSIHSIRFLDQDDYDRLLWLCGINFVRGEDSFVRAQWAEHPFVWHIYPQSEGAHWRKHDAFLDRYVRGLTPGAVTASRAFWRALNGADTEAIAGAWREFLGVRTELDRHSIAWARHLETLPEFATGLVEAAQVRV